MAIRWTVRLVKAPERNDFRDGFFPRGFHYKREAEWLVAEVRQKGGEAKIEPGDTRGEPAR